MTPSAESLIQRAAAKHGSVLDYMRGVALDRTFAVEHDIAAKSAVTPNTMPLASRPGYYEIVGPVEHAAALANIGAIEIPFASPTAVATGVPEPVWTGRSSAKPVVAAPFTSVTLDPRVCASLIVLSKETLRASGERADSVLAKILKQAATRALNASLLSNAEAVEDLSPAGLAYDLTPLTVASLGDEDIFAAIMELVDGMSKPTLVANLPAALRLRSALGSATSLLDIHMAPEAELVFAVDEGALVYAFSGIDVQSSEQATLQMTDSPSNDPASMVSMFQTNNVALRVDTYANWQVVNADGVRVLSMDLGSS
jgi:hypothetical protein